MMQTDLVSESNERLMCKTSYMFQEQINSDERKNGNVLGLAIIYRRGLGSGSGREEDWGFLSKDSNN